MLACMLEDYCVVSVLRKLYTIILNQAYQQTNSLSYLKWMCLNSIIFIVVLGEDVLFSNILLDKLDRNSLGIWVQFNRGAFVVSR